MNSVEIHRGSSPVILGLPHTGKHVPDDVFARLNAEGQKLRDTDWHIHRLYDGLLAGATFTGIVGTLHGFETALRSAMISHSGRP